MIRSILHPPLLLGLGAVVFGASLPAAMEPTQAPSAVAVDDRVDSAPPASAAARRQQTTPQRGIRDAAIEEGRSRTARARRAAAVAGEGEPTRDEGARREPAPLAPEQVDALIAVANDLSSDWAAWLRERRAADPEGLQSAIRTHGRRLIALAVLREQSPDLYELKIDEIRLQAEVGDAAERHRMAVAEGRDDDARRILAELRVKATEQVDQSLKARAAELAALDLQVRRLKEDLVEDTRNRSGRIDELLRRLTDEAGGLSVPPPPAEAAAPAANSIAR